MSSLLIPVTVETQIFFENECTNKGYTFETFLKLLVDNYIDKNKKDTEEKEKILVIDSEKKIYKRKKSSE